MEVGGARTAKAAKRKLFLAHLRDDGATDTSRRSRRRMPLPLVLAAMCTGPSEAAPAALRLHVAPMQGFTNTHLRFLLRRLSGSVVLWTEMEKPEDLLASDSALTRRLAGSEDQGPVVLQLGGSDPRQLALATAAAMRFRFDEVNLNCGCPTVQAGVASYGAALMQQPLLARECVRAIHAAAGGRPVSVKCRINAHDDVARDGRMPEDSFEVLEEFVTTVRGFRGRLGLARQGQAASDCGLGQCWGREASGRIRG